MNEDQIKYLTDNIIAINSTNFDPANVGVDGTRLFGSKTDFKTAMKGYFVERLKKPEFDKILQLEFRAENYVKARILDIANRHFILKADLQAHYDSILQLTIKDEIDKVGFISHTIEYIKKNMSNEHHYKYTTTSLKKILEKQYDFIFSNGFPTNIQNINTGVMTANAGDSAQFLFLARAILAGFNCSNVDVRSSKYDAVVDYNNTLLRIQIKGASGSSISFKDRDRGGQGIDHHHVRNQGQRITAEHCDIYVAVDKQVGICYLIPMSYVDGLAEGDITNINLSTLQQYKENWNVISEVAIEKNVRI